jgi:ABC-type sulfate transport system permease subunit
MKGDPFEQPVIIGKPYILKFFFFGKLMYVLKEEDTNIIRGIPQIYNDIS